MRVGVFIVIYDVFVSAVSVVWGIIESEGKANFDCSYSLSSAGCLFERKLCMRDQFCSDGE